MKLSASPAAAPAPLPAQLASGRTLVMGVVNVTPDSFSDGGKYLATEQAIAHAQELCEQGADIVDIGGESTRPGAAPVTAEQEQARVVPVIAELARGNAVISMDTIHAATAQAAIEAGAHIVNDVSSGLHDPQMHPLIAQTGVVYICQHWRGNPNTMDQLTDYQGDVVAGVAAELRQRLESLHAAGVQDKQIVLDPGLGFAKTHPQSWQLLAATQRLVSDLHYPLLVGASRKRFLAAATAPADAADPLSRDFATASTTTLAAAAGAWAVRVHNVTASLDAVRTVALWKENQ